MSGDCRRPEACGAAVRSNAGRDSRESPAAEVAGSGAIPRPIPPPLPGRGAGKRRKGFYSPGPSPAHGGSKGTLGYVIPPLRIDPPLSTFGVRPGLDSFAVDDCSGAIDGHVCDPLDGAAGQRPLDFQPIRLGVFPPSQHFPRVRVGEIAAAAPLQPGARDSTRGQRNPCADRVDIMNKCLRPIEVSLP